MLKFFKNLRNKLTVNELPWRTNYESFLSYAWSGACFYFVLQILFNYVQYGFVQTPKVMLCYFYLFCSFLYWALRLLQSQSNQKWQSIIESKNLEIKSSELLQNEKCKNHWWLGQGFFWQTVHSQRQHFYQEYSNVQKMEMGSKWIGALEKDQENIYLPVDYTNGHLLIVGTTGAGKTRAFEVFIQQAILRNESVIIVDPKGDRALRDNTLQICTELNLGHKFLVFHPAFAQQSIAINTLANFSKSSDLANRIVQITPSSPGDQPFRAYAYSFVLSVVDALIYLEQSITLIRIYNAITIGVKELLADCLRKHFFLHKLNQDGMDKAFDLATNEQISGDMPTRTFNKVINFYLYAASKEYPNKVLPSLINLFQQDPKHQQKMLASFLPALKVLTSGNMAEILCPDLETLGSKINFSFDKLLTDNYIIYLGLDSLTDSTLSSNIGSMLLADLASLAGYIYNNQALKRPINVFVDEAAEVINDPFIQILNKGRGAGMRCFVATQTLADLTVRTNSEFKTRQILGNFNNWLALRTTDFATQEYLANSMQNALIKNKNQAYGQQYRSLSMSSSTSVNIVREKQQMFASQLFAQLPNFEYLGNFAGGKIVKGRLMLLKKEEKQDKSVN